MTEKALLKKLADKEYREGFSEGLVDDRLSAQIFYLRKERGWTQRDLSERSGVSAATISALEESVDGARLSTLRKVAAAFDVVLDAKLVSFADFVGSMTTNQTNKKIPSYDEAKLSVRPATKTEIRASSQVLISFLPMGGARLSSIRGGDFSSAEGKYERKYGYV